SRRRLRGRRFPVLRAGRRGGGQVRLDVLVDVGRRVDVDAVLGLRLPVLLEGDGGALTGALDHLLADLLVLQEHGDGGRDAGRVHVGDGDDALVTDALGLGRELVDVARRRGAGRAERERRGRGDDTEGAHGARDGTAGYGQN